MPTPKPRNRAAQDATLINIRRLKRQVSNLAIIVAGLAKRLSKLERA